MRRAGLSASAELHVYPTEKVHGLARKQSKCLQMTFEYWPFRNKLLCHYERGSLVIFFFAPAFDICQGWLFYPASVCLSVCQQDNSKSCYDIWWIFCAMCYWQEMVSFRYWSRSRYVRVRIRLRLLWRRFLLTECSCASCVLWRSWYVWWHSNHFSFTAP